MQELCDMVDHLRQQTEETLMGSRTATPILPQEEAVPTVPPTQERIYVYAPRETKCPRFSGELKGQGSGVEDWITEVRKALLGRPWTPAEQVTWVCDLLDGEAKREVAFSLDLEGASLDAIFDILLEHFGCDQTYIAIQRQFFHRQQGEKESLREFTQALTTLLNQLQQKDHRLVPFPDMILRDTFVENLFNTKLHQELSQTLRNHPERTFREIRDLALQWERRQVALDATRPRVSPAIPTSRQGNSLAKVDTQSAHSVSNELQECREALRKQQQQLDLILQRLATPLTDPRERPPPGYHASGQRPPLPFCPDGTPICLRCHEPGHIARRCPNVTSRQTPAPPRPRTQAQTATPAENENPPMQ